MHYQRPPHGETKLVRCTKGALYDAAMEHFAEARERREKLEQDPDTVEDILRAGAAKAREVGREVLDRCRAACGLKATL